MKVGGVRFAEPSSEPFVSRITRCLDSRLRVLRRLGLPAGCGAVISSAEVLGGRRKDGLIVGDTYQGFARDLAEVGIRINDLRDHSLQAGNAVAFELRRNPPRELKLRPGSGRQAIC